MNQKKIPEIKKSVIKSIVIKKALEEISYFILVTSLCKWPIYILQWKPPIEITVNVTRPLL
jgi:hypothetical protein